MSTPNLSSTSITIGDLTLAPMPDGNGFSASVLMAGGDYIEAVLAPSQIAMLYLYLKDWRNHLPDDSFEDYAARGIAETVGRRRLEGERR